MRNASRVLGFFALLAAGSILLCLGVAGPCWSAWLLDGIRVRTCPSGDVRPTAVVQADGVGRGAEGVITVRAVGHYAERGTGAIREARIRRFDPRFDLTDPDGKTTRLDVLDDEDLGAGGLACSVKLPDGPDGDWKLHVVVDTPAGEAPVDVTLPLYVPAIAHVLTDAPLYKPGQTLRFRAVLLAEGDLTPLEGRPGVWRVTDPEGEVLLEEKGRTGRFGVAASTLPLASDAVSGAYTVAFESGAARHAQTVEVKTFQLPRFTVDATSERRFWVVGDTPVVSGTVRYTSGAPVTHAAVAVDVSASGEWPPPPEWLASRTVVTDAAGRFRVAFDAVPADLQGQATLSLRLAATDDTGDTNYGGASALLSADRIVADAVTELADGLVPSANNRVFLRVTTADGEPLRGATVRVSREGATRDEGVVATADADGVARLQLDPGKPVTVVVPPLPVREERRVDAGRVTAGSGEDLVEHAALGVEGIAVVTRWGSAAQECLSLGEPGHDTTVAVVARMDRSGRVTHAQATASDGNAELAACVARRVRGVAGGGGGERVWAAQVTVPDAALPWVTPDLSFRAGSAPTLDGAIRARLHGARACVAAERQALDFPSVWFVHVDRGSTRVDLVPTDTNAGRGVVSDAVAACVARTLQGVSLDEPADEEVVGLLSLTADVPASLTPPVPQPTTFPGYALRVAAEVGGERVGETVLRLRPGTIPPLRLRFSEVLVEAGAEVELTAVRGPDFSGEIPKKLSLVQGDREVLEFDVADRKGRFTLPEDARGYYRVSSGGAQATLYVRDPRQLRVAVTSPTTAWRPGQEVELRVTTEGASGPVPAGVTLSGVDRAFAAIAPLPGPTAFADVTVLATSELPAFGVLDARALQTGLVRGENAAQAAVLRVSTIPSRPPGADRVSASGASVLDVDGELTDTFYALYGEARRGVRAWEAKAPADEMLSAKEMIALWEEALAAHPAEDPFGRSLHLSVLPPDLLQLVDPRFMVSDGARLPEDVENWSVTVASEAR